MGGVFDRLQSRLEAGQPEGGISLLDLKDLPAGMRKVMRLMLREVEMSYPAICAAVDNMPPDERLSRAELDETLDTLTQQLWLIRLGLDQTVTYRVNLRRRPASKLAQGFWGALDTKIGAAKKSSAPPPPTEPDDNV